MADETPRGNDGGQAASAGADDKQKAKAAEQDKNAQAQEEQRTILQKIMDFIRQLFGGKKRAGAEAKVDQKDNENNKAQPGAGPGEKGDGDEPGRDRNHDDQDMDASMKMAPGGAGAETPDAEAPKSAEGIEGDWMSKGPGASDSHRGLLDFANQAKQNQLSAPDVSPAPGLDGPKSQSDYEMKMQKHSAFLDKAMAAVDGGIDGPNGAEFKRELNERLARPSDRAMTPDDLVDAYVASAALDAIERSGRLDVDDDDYEEQIAGIKNGVLDNSLPRFGGLANNGLSEQQLNDVHGRIRASVDKKNPDVLDSRYETIPKQEDKRPGHGEMSRNRSSMSAPGS